MKILSLVKYFILRAYHDILPTQLILVRSKILDQPLCPVCELVEETLSHSLWECAVASHMWGEVLLSKWSTKIRNFRELWAKIVDTLPPKSQKLCAIILRKLWLRRNSFLFDNKFDKPKVVVQSALLQLETFQVGSYFIPHANVIPRSATRQTLK